MTDSSSEEPDSESRYDLGFWVKMIFGFVLALCLLGAVYSIYVPQDPPSVRAARSQ